MKIENSKNLKKKIINLLLVFIYIKFLFFLNCLNCFFFKEKKTKKKKILLKIYVKNT